jgi:hypothetical protein
MSKCGKGKSRHTVSKGKNNVSRMDNVTWKGLVTEIMLESMD